MDLIRPLLRLLVVTILVILISLVLRFHSLPESRDIPYKIYIQEIE